MIARVVTCPLEAEEQEKFFEWVELAKNRHTELETIYSSANGEVRPRKYNKKTGSWYCPSGKRLKKQGARRGIPDVHLPVSRGGFASLFLELKRVRGGRLSTDQVVVIRDLRKHGNKVVVCKGCDAAIAATMQYLSLS